MIKALSIKQPWAWLIVNGYKKIENRNWATKFRGEVLIHASKGMTKQEYSDVVQFLINRNIKVELPDYYKLERGGIVGRATIVDCVSHSKDPFFLGDYGFVLRNAKPLEFIECKGSLGFWNFEGDLP